MTPALFDVSLYELVKIYPKAESEGLVWFKALWELRHAKVLNGSSR